MYIVLVIALLSTLMWVNTLFTEYINAKLNPYRQEGSEEIDKQRARLKLVLLIITALFWGAYIIYS
jgi:hypothetical protein